MKKILGLILLLLFFSCKKESLDKVAEVEQDKLLAESSERVHQGKELMESKCYACHNPTTPESSRLAPPMVAIKAHYINENTSKEDFTQAVWDFVQQPSIEKVKLRGAERRFGLMPYQEFSEDEIKMIADYMFEFQIEEPAWFKDHFRKGRGGYRQPGKKMLKAGSKGSDIKAQGLNIAMATKAALGSKLLGTIQEKGTLAALEYCNENAIPLTDSMAKVHKATIKRVSDQPRKTENQANKKELTFIKQFKELIGAGQDYKPIVERENGRVYFYAPIITNSACLQCHGTPGSDIKEEVLSSLNDLYPDDRAIDYNINQVRGIWNISYSEE